MADAPENVSATASGDDITISWDDVDGGVSEYRIYRSRQPGVTTDDTLVATVADDDSATYSYTDAGLLDGEQYHYAVESVTPFTLIEDYEDTDPLSEWTSPGTFSASTAQSFNGSTAMRSDTGSSDFIHSTSGLPAYPSHGDTFSVYVRISANSDYHATLFADDASGSNYALLIDPSSNALELFRDLGGSNTSLALTNFAMSTDVWRELRIDWQDTITATVYTPSGTQQASVSATDTSYTSGGIGAQANNRSNITSAKYWDYWRIL
jgi:hypothetical protein